MIGEHLKETMHLDGLEEHGAYFLLQLYYWNSSGVLPDDEKFLQKILKISSHKFKKISQNILKNFRNENGYLKHDRLDAEIEKAIQIQKDKRLRTKKAREVKAIKRASVTETVTTPVTALPSPLPLPKQDKSCLNYISPTVVGGATSGDESGNCHKSDDSTVPDEPHEAIPKQKPVKPATYPQDFERFWLGWPKERRCEKPKAYKAWKDAVRKATPEDLLDSLARYCQSREVIEGFSPYPAKWLKGERWNEAFAAKEKSKPDYQQWAVEFDAELFGKEKI